MIEAKKVTQARFSVEQIASVGAELFQGAPEMFIQKNDNGESEIIHEYLAAVALDFLTACQQITEKHERKESLK